MLVPAYLLIVPMQYEESWPATATRCGSHCILEAVERAALTRGIAVDARIEKGRGQRPCAPEAVGRGALRPHPRPRALQRAAWRLHGGGARLAARARAARTGDARAQARAPGRASGVRGSSRATAGENGRIVFAPVSPRVTRSAASSPDSATPSTSSAEEEFVMKIGVLGTGMVGNALATNCVEARPRGEDGAHRGRQRQGARMNCRWGRGRAKAASRAPRTASSCSTPPQGRFAGRLDAAGASNLDGVLHDPRQPARLLGRLARLADRVQRRLGRRAD